MGQAPPGGQLANRGNKQAYDAHIGAIKTSPDFAIRMQAAAEMAEIAELGDPNAIETLGACIKEDSEPKVRLKALKSLGILAAQSENSDVVSVIARCIDSETDPYTAKAALEALRKVARRGDTHAVLPVIRRLDTDSRVQVRTLAAELIGHIALVGDLDAIEALLRRLDVETDANCKRCVAHSLSEVAERGNSRVLAALARCLDEPNKDKLIFEEAVTEAIKCLAPRTNGRQNNAKAIVAISTIERKDLHAAPFESLQKHAELNGGFDRKLLDRLVEKLMGEETAKELLRVLSPLLDGMVDSATGTLDIREFCDWLCRA